MNWRSRWVMVPALILAAVLLWNLYVAAHSHGVVEGYVLDPEGKRVAGADVVLYARSFLTNDERGRTRTGPDGRFRFTGNHDHALQLQADAPGLGRSERVTVRLLFRGEDIDLGRPLQLSGSP